MFDRAPAESRGGGAVLFFPLFMYILCPVMVCVYVVAKLTVIRTSRLKLIWCFWSSHALYLNSVVTFANDMILLNSSLVWTMGTKSYLVRAVLFIVVTKFNCLPSLPSPLNLRVAPLGTLDKLTLSVYADWRREGALPASVAPSWRNHRLETKEKTGHVSAFSREFTSGQSSWIKHVYYTFRAFKM